MNDWKQRQQMAVHYSMARQAVMKGIVKACNGYRTRVQLSDPHTAQRTWEFACEKAEESNYLLVLSLKRNAITISPSL